MDLMTVLGQNGQRRYRIIVDMEKGFERSIEIEIIRKGASQVAVYVAWNREPTL